MNHSHIIEEMDNAIQQIHEFKRLRKDNENRLDIMYKRHRDIRSECMFESSDDVECENEDITSEVKTIRDNKLKMNINHKETFNMKEALRHPLDNNNNNISLESLQIDINKLKTLEWKNNIHHNAFNIEKVVDEYEILQAIEMEEKLNTYSNNLDDILGRLEEEENTKASYIVPHNNTSDIDSDD